MRLRERFKFGSLENARDQVIHYCGNEIRQNPDWSISLTQERFALGIDEIPMTKERKEEKESEVNKEEKRSLRQVLGALSWRATQSAPWLLAPVSILQGCVEGGKVQNILEVNKLVRLQRKCHERGLQFP